MVNMKTLINRLMQWLKDHGFTAEEITDCIDFITRNK